MECTRLDNQKIEGPVADESLHPLENLNVPSINVSHDEPYSPLLSAPPSGAFEARAGRGLRRCGAGTSGKSLRKHGIK
jgi:hypothetical protein